MVFTRIFVSILIAFSVLTPVKAGFLLLDLGGLGAPDLLAGPDAWSSVRTTSESPHPRICRAFRLHLGVQPTLWEWMGPTAGLLVYSPTKVPEGQLDGSQIVGNWLGDKDFPDAYAALASLDRGGDQRLNGHELDFLYVWVDANLDGLAQPVEIRPASDVVVSLSTYPARQGKAAWSEGGASLSGGKQVYSWDWAPASMFGLVDKGGKAIPLALPTYFPEGSPGSPPPVVYRWSLSKEGVFGLYRFFNVGSSLWVATLGPDFGQTGLVSVGEVFLEEKGTKISWVVSNGGVQWSKVEATIDKKGDLKGTVTYGTDTFGMEAQQAVPPFIVHPAVMGAVAIPDASLQQAVLEIFPTQVQVPFGQTMPVIQNRVRGIKDLSTSP